MRFFSSSALASAEKLRLAASCYAAETIESSLPPQICQALALTYRGSGALFALFTLRCQDFDRTTGLLHRLHGRFGGAEHFEIHLGLELAAAEQPHAILGAAHQPGLDQRRAQGQGEFR